MLLISQKHYSSYLCVAYLTVGHGGISRGRKERGLMSSALRQRRTRWSGCQTERRHHNEGSETPYTVTRTSHLCLTTQCLELLINEFTAINGYLHFFLYVFTSSPLFIFFICRLSSSQFCFPFPFFLFFISFPVASVLSCPPSSA